MSKSVGSAVEYSRMSNVLFNYPDIGRRKLSKLARVTEKIARNFLDSKRSIDDKPCTKQYNKSESINNSHIENGNSATSISNAKKPLTVDEVAKLWNVDTSKWNSVRLHTNSWDTTNTNGVTYTNYQTKVIWEKIQAVFDLEIILDNFVNKAKKHSPKYSNIQKKNINKSGNLLEIDIRDLHLGKLCWHGETGENYDVHIARKRAMECIDKLVSKALMFGFDEIVFVGSDDFFNSDTTENTTTRGTRQDDDVRWQKMFCLGKDLFVDIIDKLRQYAPVKCIMIVGNHDTQKSFYLGEVLSAWYSNCNNVTIDNSAKIRKYHNHGKVLLGFTHGNDIKVDKLPSMMAIEQPKMWGDTKYREFHIGHLHSKKEIKWISTQESDGVVVRQMRSLAGTDCFHYTHGYIGALKGAEAFIWNKNEGLSVSFETYIDIK